VGKDRREDCNNAVYNIQRKEESSTAHPQTPKQPVEKRTINDTSLPQLTTTRKKEKEQLQLA
jgi:hypothetical protein